MPLPLPNLDTRRWSDLVEEGRALIPRHSPQLTDHNVHDPAITLIELFAYLVEGLIFRANRIPRRHRWKFLALAGFHPRPPTPATAVLGASLVGGAGTQALPAGVVFLGSGDAGVLPFQVLDQVTLVEANLAAVQVYDGAAFVDRSSVALGQVAFAALGTNPLSGSAELYLGLDRPLPAGVEVTIHVAFADEDPDERARLAAEQREERDACHHPPGRPCTPCPPRDDRWCPGLPAVSDAATSAGESSAGEMPAHHSARTVWEYLAPDGWQTLTPGGGLIDPTRSLTLSGAVRITVPGPMAQRQIGAVPRPLHYLRCRQAAGHYDAAPIVSGIVFNAIVVEQRRPVWQSLAIAPGAAVTAPIKGSRQPLDLGFDDQDRITSLGLPAPDGRPELLVLDYTAPTAEPGSLTLGAELAMRGTGLPDQVTMLSRAQVTRAEADLWSVEGPTWLRWEQRPDLDASGPLDPHHVLDPSAARIHFGSGARGRVVPEGAAILASYTATAAAAGELRPGRPWILAADPWNEVVLAATGATVSSAGASLASLRNPRAAAGAADRETLESVEARAVAVLWAHERLVQLVPEDGAATLDQLDRADVLARAAPSRATTLLDYERLALGVPGTRVRRARAWSGLDPGYPCLDVAGTVTVVILPSLPAERPQPSAGLIRAVHRYLDRRRVLCTRLVVSGPLYVVVSVHAAVAVHRGANAERVRSHVAEALRHFLDPLEGGPARRGWPFGRDVYRSEILAEIDRVPGVDHVLSCTLSAPEMDAGCVNLCLSPTSLAASGEHRIEVVE